MNQLSKLYKPLLGLSLFFISLTSESQTIDPNTSKIHTDGTVFSVDANDNYIVLGGNFTRVGGDTSFGAITDGTSGDVLATNPEPNGTVWVCEPDGSGGFYIGGEFTEIGGVSRAGLAHVTASGTVSSWDPGIVGIPFIIKVSGSTVYIGGSFSEIGGESRNALAAVTTGGSVTSWNPEIGGSWVYSLAVSSSSIFVGGVFSGVGLDSRSNLAEISTSTGAVTSWDPSPNNHVNTLAIDGNTLYVGGRFTSISGTARNRIASYDITTGSLNTWNPNASSNVEEILVYGSDVVVAGNFNAIGGSGNDKLAIIDGTTGLATAFAPNPGNGSLFDLALDGDILYTAGGTYAAFNRPRKHVAAYDLSAGTLLDWDPGIDHQNGAYDLAVSGGQVYVGGAFNVIGGTRRVGLAVLDKETLDLASIDVEVTGFFLPEVRAVKIISNAVVFGGDFSEVGGQSRTNLASVSLSSGLVTSWSPSVSGEIFTIASNETTIYVGGDFNFIEGEMRNNAAQINAASGAVTTWDPDFNNDVNELLVSGSSVYATGFFSTVGGTTRNYLAEVDAVSGTVSSWDPNLNDEGNALAIGADGNIYVGGEFTSVGGTSRNRLAAIDPASALATSWNLNTGGEVNDLISTQSLVYVGGDFPFAASTSIRSVAALDIANEQLAAWDAQLTSDAEVQTLFVTEDNVMVFGDFNSTGSDLNKNFLLTRANDGPTNISISSTTFEENSTNVFVGTLTASDEPGDTHTFGLVSGAGDTNNANFSINGNKLNFKGTANFEAKSNYSVRIEAKDQNGFSYSKTFSLTVTDQPDPPSSIKLSPSNIDENSAADAVVGTVSVSDEDSGDSHVLSFVSGSGDSHNALFTLDRGNLILKEGVNHEKFDQLFIRLEAEDQSRLTIESELVITINDVPESPTNILLLDNNIDENESIGTTVGNFSTTDPDDGETHTYTLVSGTGDTDNASFTIDGNKLKSAETFDFETKSTYSIRVQTDDGSSTPFAKAMQVDVDDVDEEGPMLLSSMPADGEMAADPPSMITLDFDENIYFDSNESIFIFLKRIGVSNAVQSWEVDHGTLDDLMTVNDQQLVLETTADFFFTQDYFLEAFEVQDVLGNTSMTPQIDFTIRTAFTGNDIVDFSAPGMDGSATIDPVNHTVTATMNADAPVYVDPLFTLSDGATLFGSVPDQWATNTLYWGHEETKTVNIRSESGNTETWTITLSWAPFEGTYTVGSNGYFETLSLAMEDLQSRGQNADVTFEIEDGYEEQGQFFLDIDPYPGNDTYTTTITVEDGATSASFYFYQFGLDGIQNFVFDGKGVLNTETISGTLFDLGPDDSSNPCRNIIFRNLIGTQDESANEFAGGFISADGVENLLIEGNDLTYNFAPTVIDVRGTSNTDVEVSGNKIVASDVISLNPVSVNAAGSISIHNNSISTQSGSGSGLSTNGTADVDICHNTIHTVFTTANQSNAGIYVGQSTGMATVKNNIVSLEGEVRQTGVYVRFLEKVDLDINHNNIYLPFVSSLEKYLDIIEENEDYGELEWELLLAEFPNNTNIDIFFTDVTQGELTLSGSSLSDGELRGTPLPEVDLDINGVTRSTAGPSKGAYEYDNIATDILSFSLTDQVGTSVIDDENHTIDVVIADGSSFTQTPTISVNNGASINPASGVTQDYGIPVVYTVTAELGVTQDWTVSVTENDTNPPTVLTYSPEDEAINVNTDTDLVINFDESIESTGQLRFARVKRKSNNDILQSIALNDPSVADFSGSTLTITLSTDLPESSDLYIEIPDGAISDAAGNVFTGFSDNETWNFTTGDFTHPTITNFSPANGATGVSNDAVIELTFSEPIQLTGFGMINIKESSNNATLHSIDPAGPQVSINEHIVTITPDGGILSTDVEIEVYVNWSSTPFEDLAGNDFNDLFGTTDYRFTVDNDIDETAPAISSLSPADEANNVLPSTQLTVNFNEPVQSTGVTRFAQVIRVSDGVVLQSPAIHDPSVTDFTGAAMTISLSADLPEQTEISIVIPDGAIQDLEGNVYAGSDTWNFTTADITFPTIITFSPDNGATGVSNDAVIELTFSEPVQLTGFGTINIKEASNNATLHSINPAGPQVSINDHIVTITPDGGILSTEEEIEVYVNWSSTPFEDLAGNDFNDLFSTSDYRFTVDNTSGVIEWTGSAWSNGTGPTAADDVLISGLYTYFSNGAFECNDLTIAPSQMLVVNVEGILEVNGDIVNNGSMRITSGSTLITYATHSISGNDIEFRRNTRHADGKYSFVGTPVEQNTGTVGSDLGSSVYWYDETVSYGTDEGLSRWKNASGSQLIPGQGYTQAFKKELTFFGTPNAGTITITGTYTEDFDDANEGWNLVSNPYSAAISVEEFIIENDNITGPVYFWDDNGSEMGRGTNADYIVANGITATNTTPAGGQTRYNQHIGSSQGFFVKLNDPSDTEISFTEAMRVTGNNEDDHFFRKTTIPLARINLTNEEGLFKQTVVAEIEDAQLNDLNRLYDASAFNAASDFGIFTMKAGRSLAINGVPTNWEVIQLQLNVAVEGRYQISSELENFDRPVYLQDHETGQVIDLSNEHYEFSTGAGIDTERFELLASPADILSTASIHQIQVYAHGGQLYIIPSDKELRSYQVYNLQGRLVHDFKTNSRRIENLSSLSKGLYMVFDGERTHKILLE